MLQAAQHHNMHEKIEQDCLTLTRLICIVLVRTRLVVGFLICSGADDR